MTYGPAHTHTHVSDWQVLTHVEESHFLDADTLREIREKLYSSSYIDFVVPNIFFRFDLAPEVEASA